MFIILLTAILFIAYHKGVFDDFGPRDFITHEEFQRLAEEELNK